MQRAIASGSRVYEMLDAPLEMTEPAGARAACRGVDGEVRFDDVGFSYVDRPVLAGIDLEVPAGRTLALVGHTGCGKTTLTNLMPRFYDVSGGRVLVDGDDVRDLRLDEPAPRTSASSPRTRSCSRRRIADNIRFGRPEASDDEVREAAGAPRPTPSSRPCPTATRRSSASAG